MAGRGSEVDRLIEDGLSRYGAGDIDGALRAWEHALALDPDNEQAASYVDYVRANYELLVSASPEAAQDGAAPFAIYDEPEYIIEIIPGDLPPGEPSQIYLEPNEQGWFMEDEQTLEDPHRKKASSAPPIALELEADEPPEVSFESATREYGQDNRPTVRGRAPSEFPKEEAPTTEYNPDEPATFPAEVTSGGFANQQTTDVRKRDLGFVQPSRDIEVRLRTPGTSTPPSTTRPPPSVPGIDNAAITAKLPLAPDPDDLLGSLPSPKPAPTTVRTGKTRDLPSEPRPPARETSQSEIGLATAPTRELDNKRPQAPSQPPDPMVTAPTRDLGLRRPGTSDDSPTRESDATAFRASTTARLKPVPGAPPPEDGTRHDLVLPFDPIDARSAQILDEIDALLGEPGNEAKEDRVRRRITVLFERALAWNGTHELDKAVAAVDLAMAEDPNSALAQKLIHRNRDTIMTVFQSFLGDLERQPQLARPLHELAHAPISPRAAFLLSRIDGTLTLDEILDVSGMPRMEAYRYLCQLFLRGILK
ncbi:MAG TPA: hypothetical protein VLX92_24955 [Kofleriaceae bacterium]|nr:hypothetical protein [Kofleriaceae bacterium]